MLEGLNYRVINETLIGNTLLLFKKITLQDYSEQLQAYS